MSVKASGPIRADEIYTLGGLRRASGWGDAAIRSARRAGLKAVYLHGRVFFRGSDVVAYIDQAAKDGNK